MLPSEVIQDRAVFERQKYAELRIRRIVFVRKLNRIADNRLRVLVAIVIWVIVTDSVRILVRVKIGRARELSGATRKRFPKASTPGSSDNA